VQAVDPTGAGDAFMAGLTLRLVEGASLAAAVEFACLLGALSTTAPGAQGGWTGIDDVERLAAALASRGTHSCAGVSAGSLTRHLVPPGCASKAGS
jgi:ribokinase